MSFPAGSPLIHDPPWRIESRRVATRAELDVLSTYLGAVVGFVALRMIVAHGDRVGGLLREFVAPLRFALGD